MMNGVRRQTLKEICKNGSVSKVQIMYFIEKVKKFFIWGGQNMTGTPFIMDIFIAVKECKQSKGY